MKCLFVIPYEILNRHWFQMRMVMRKQYMFTCDIADVELSLSIITIRAIQHIYTKNSSPELLGSAYVKPRVSKQRF